MQTGTAMAHLFASRFDAASSWAEKASRELPSFLLAVGIIAASHALAGRSAEARLLLERDPDLTSPRGRAARTLLYLFDRDHAVKTLRAG